MTVEVLDRWTELSIGLNNNKIFFIINLKLNCIIAIITINNVTFDFEALCFVAINLETTIREDKSNILVRNSGGISNLSTRVFNV